MYKRKSLKHLHKVVTRKYSIQVQQSNDIVSAVFYPKDEFVVTSAQIIKGIKKLENCETTKIAIAYNFSVEAEQILREHGFQLVKYSNFPWTDDKWKNRPLL